MGDPCGPLASGPGFAFDDFSLLGDLPRQEWPEGLDPELI